MSVSKLCLSWVAPTCVCHMSGSQLCLSWVALTCVCHMNCSQLCLSQVALTSVCHKSSCHLCSLKGCAATTRCEQVRVSLSTQAISLSLLSIPCKLGRLKPQLTRSSLPSCLKPSQDPPHTGLDSPSVPVFWCPWQQQVMSWLARRHGLWGGEAQEFQVGVVEGGVLELCAGLRLQVGLRVAAREGFQPSICWYCNMGKASNIHTTLQQSICWYCNKGKASNIHTTKYITKHIHPQQPVKQPTSTKQIQQINKYYFPFFKQPTLDSRNTVNNPWFNKLYTANHTHTSNQSCSQSTNHIHTCTTSHTFYQPYTQPVTESIKSYTQLTIIIFNQLCKANLRFRDSTHPTHRQRFYPPYTQSEILPTLHTEILPTLHTEILPTLHTDRDSTHPTHRDSTHPAHRDSTHPTHRQRFYPPYTQTEILPTLHTGRQRFYPPYTQTTQLSYPGSPPPRPPPPPSTHSWAPVWWCWPAEAGQQTG